MPASATTTSTRTARRGNVDWYRRELRDYVELNHRSSVFFKAPVPVANYDVPSDCYSWDWGRLHLVQMHRFAGDTRKGALDSLPWLEADLAAHAADGRPVILFQHYGWDAFSDRGLGPGAAHLRRRAAPARRTGGPRRSATRWPPRSSPTTSSPSSTATSTRAR